MADEANHLGWAGVERKKKIEQAIVDGNLSVHEWPFTIHTETADLENLVVNFTGIYNLLHYQLFQLFYCD